MARSAPAASALARSPEYLMPPSAMTGVPVFSAASTASMIAVSCGTPTPATMRVVQIEPGPMPTLMASAPASISALAPSAVATLPAMTCTALESFLMRVDGVEHALRMAMRGVDDHQVDARRRSAARCARSPRRRPWWRRRRAAGPARPCRRSGWRRLLDVLDGDQPDAAIIGRPRPAASRCGVGAGAAWPRPARRPR